MDLDCRSYLSKIVIIPSQYKSHEIKNKIKNYWNQIPCNVNRIIIIKFNKQESTRKSQYIILSVANVNYSCNP